MQYTFTNSVVNIFLLFTQNAFLDIVVKIICSIHWRIFKQSYDSCKDDYKGHKQRKPVPLLGLLCFVFIRHIGLEFKPGNFKEEGIPINVRPPCVLFSPRTQTIVRVIRVKINRGSALLMGNFPDFICRKNLIAVYKAYPRILSFLYCKKKSSLIQGGGVEGNAKKFFFLRRNLIYFTFVSCRG